MNPDVAPAISRLLDEERLPAGPGKRLAREAWGDLVSISGEIRVVLWAGVSLLTTAVGLLVKENYERIGPVAIAVALALVAAACLFVAWRKAPPFSWGEVPSPHVAFDALLVLGLLIASADLAFIEWKFTPLGAEWPWHLLLVALAALALAIRHDSRVLFSLALSTFAAWRGISAGRALQALDGGATPVRINLLVCGLLFLALGEAFRRFDRKAHFEPAAAHAGWFLFLAALASGIDSDLSGALHASLLLATGGLLGFLAWRGRRFSLFALGAIGAWVGFQGLVAVHLGFGTFDCLWWTGTSLGMLWLLRMAQRKLKEPL